MDYPDNTFYDTLSAYRAYFGYSLESRELHIVADAYGYDLTPHYHALADAEACAAIAMKIF